MTVARLNEFQARPGEQERLYDFLLSIVPRIQSLQGCHACHLLRSEKDPARLLVLEFWRSIDAHQAATRQIPSEMLQEGLAMLASPPTGEYYRLGEISLPGDEEREAS